VRNDPIQSQRQDRNALVRELESAGAKFKGSECTCPFHDDKRASAGVYEDAEGNWRFKCHSQSCAFGGDIFDVRSRLTGAPLADVLRDASGRQERRTPVYPTLDALRRTLPGEIVSEHNYETTPNETAMVVFRCRVDDGKTYRPAHPAEGGWRIGSPAKPWILYGLPQITQASSVVVVEGERCVDALSRLGIPATTSPAGAGKAGHADWTPLAGKHVVLWPDNDESGKAHMQHVKAILERLHPPANVSWIDPDTLGLDAKGDVADVAERLRSSGKAVSEIADHVRRILDGAAYTGPLSDLDDEFNAVADGTIYTVPWPWRMLSDFTQALAPGKVVLVSGSPGAAKSLFVLQCVQSWLDQGESVAFYCMEGTANDHLRRALAQIVGKSVVQVETSSITKDSWLKANIEKACEWRREHEAELARLAGVMETTSRSDRGLDSRASAGRQAGRCCRSDHGGAANGEAVD